MTKCRWALRDGLVRQLLSIKTGFPLPIIAANQLVNLYAKHGLIGEAQTVFDEMPQRNIFSWNAIISAHIKSNNLSRAKYLFDSAPARDIVTYNSMLYGYANANGFESHALQVFAEMHVSGFEIGVDEFTLTTMLKLASKMGLLTHGRQLHCYMDKTGNGKTGFSASSLIDMYSKCGSFVDACEVFEGWEGVVDSVSRNAMLAACCREGQMAMALRLFWRECDLNDVVSWNTLIMGLVQNGEAEEAVKLFRVMGDSGVKWNEHSFSSLLSACSLLRDLKLGKEVHAWTLRNGMSSNLFVESGIVDAYCKCGSMKYAELMMMVSGTRSNFAITSMIVGHSMLGNMVEARRLFDSLEEKNAVVWTALFAGYANLQQCNAVFELWSEFTAKETIIPDALILAAVLRACALQAALNPGKQIHGYTLRMGIDMDQKMANAMVDMYSKSGCITYAKTMFRKVGLKDSVLYNVMIAGCAHHGNEDEAIELFQEMLEKGAKPDAVTFIALLSACRHSGLVALGEKLFHSMIQDYNIQPESDHYACMIDLYGRANQLGTVKVFMSNIPSEKQDGVVFGAVLAACRLNKNTKLAKEAGEKLLNTEGDNGSRYVQLANVYAAEGNWSEMGRIRKKMKEKEAKRLAGCSWVFMDNGVHTFISGDKTHSKARAIYSVLNTLMGKLCEVAEMHF